MKKYIIVITAVLFTALGCSKAGAPTSATSPTDLYPTPSPTPEMKTFSIGERYCDFSPRENFGALESNGRLFVIAGRDVTGCVNDIWYTQDCESWVSLTAKTAFEARELFNAESYNDRVFITGGGNRNAYYDDTWCLSGGVTLTAVPVALPYSPRAAAGSAVWKDALIITGGADSKNSFNDVWSLNLRDPKTWVKLKENSDKGFKPRSGHRTLNFSGKLWVMGGKLQDNTLVNDVWSSENGVDWKLVTPTAGFTPRENFGEVVYKDRMWVTGGENSTGGCESDIWWSINGYYWVSTTAKAAFGGREGFAAAQYQGKIWIIGGRDKDKMKRDIWSGQ